jgi:hypothetical protein
LCTIYHPKFDDTISISKALSNLEPPQWQKTTNQEYDSLINNSTWSLLIFHATALQYPTNGFYARNTMWIIPLLDIKPNLFMVLPRNPQLTMKIYLFIIIKMTSFFVMIAIVAIHDLGIHQMDVNFLFLHGEKFYMNNPLVLINLELSIKFVNCYTPHMVLNNPSRVV